MVQPNKFLSLDQAIDRQPLTVSPNRSLIEVISLMQEWGNSCNFSDRNNTLEIDAANRSNNSCVLITENGILQGVFTERDLVRLVATEFNPQNISIQEVMSPNVISLTATGQEDIFTALNLLRRHRIRHLPIIDSDRQLLGLITAKNLRQKLQPINLMKWRKVAEIMNSEIVYADPSDSVRQIAKLMADLSVSCVAIAETRTDSTTNLPFPFAVGIITERDIVQFQNLNLDFSQPACNLMSSPLFLVSPEDSLWSIHQQMQQRRVRRLLVGGERGELRGIITQTSLLEIFDPTEMYSVIEMLERQVCQLEITKNRLLENRQLELETEVTKQTNALKTANQKLEAEVNLRQEKEQRFDSILNSLKDVVYSIAPKSFEIFYLNSAVEKIHGLSAAQFYQNPQLWIEMVHPEDRDRFKAGIQTAIAQEANEIEYRIIRPDGTIRWLYDRTRLVKEENKAVRLDGIATDITQRKQAENLLIESQERYDLAVRGSRDGLWDWNILTNEVFYAPRFQEMLGYADTEMPNTFEAWSSRLHPEDRTRVLEAIQKHIEKGTPYDVEYRLQTKQGEYSWFNARGQAIWNQQQQAVRMAGSITEIGDRKLREAILKDIASGISVEIGSNFLFSLVKYLSKILKAQCVYVGKLTGVNQNRIKTLAVYAQGEIQENFEYDLRGTPCSKVIQQHLCIYPEAVQELFPRSSMLQDIAAESFAGMPIVNSKGNTIGLIAIVDSKPFENISLIEEVLTIFVTRVTTELERQQAEQKLQKSNKILQAISSIQTQFLTDAQPGITFDGMLDALLELTASEYGFIGEILFDANGSPVMEESYMKFRGRPYLKTHAITNIAWNEETRAFYAENAPKGMEFHNLQTLFGAVIVTGEPVIANSPSTDPRRGGLPEGHPPLNAFLGVPFYKNNKMTGMVGIANCPGGYDRSVIHYLQPLLDTCSRIIEAYKSDRQKQRAEQKVREQATLLNVATDAIMVRGLDDQLLFWNQGAERLYGWKSTEALDQDANKLLYQKSSAELAQIQQIVREQGEWLGELNQVTSRGEKIVVQSHWTLVTDSEDKPQSYLVVNTDITEQKKLETQFLRTQRLESLGTLAGGIAHDLNNILAPILGFAKLLPLKLTNVDQQTLQFFQIIETNAQRGTALVKQILTFAQGLEGDRGIIQIRHLIAEIEQIMTETFPKNIELNTSVAKNLWTIDGDATQIHQVLMNLVVNARDAMNQGGKLTIAAKNFVIDPDFARLNLDAREGKYIVIEVADTGMGIPPQIIERIFEPFFTTKELGRGTGLGLSTAIGIIRSHGGFIDVQSETAQGTQFKVFLPASDTAEVQPLVEKALPQGNGELILVVDDEKAICEVTQATLETFNYQVLTAHNGIDAIALYAQNQPEIRLVIMDITMPNMDGKTAILTLRRINPQIKIIAVSGLSSNREAIAEIDESQTVFLAKPYSNDELLNTIAQLLSDDRI